MKSVLSASNWLCDMDGVLIRDEAMIEGADRFLAWLASNDRSYLIITNNSMFTPRELSDRLRGLGLDVPAHRLWTSAMATAQFVATQRPAGSAFVIGEPSLHEALAEVGYTERAHWPDYVVLGECSTLSFDEVTTAVRLIEKGSRFVATNPEPTGPSADGAVPAVGAMAAMIERATGVAPYFVGKPNSMMIREALHRLDAHSSNTVLVGDRMETDILAGIEAGLTTVLVLSGVTSPADVDRYPYGPSRVVRSLAELVDAAL